MQAARPAEADHGVVEGAKSMTSRTVTARTDDDNPHLPAMPGLGLFELDLLLNEGTVLIPQLPRAPCPA